MSCVTYGDLDYVVDVEDASAVYGGFNWGNLFKNVFTYVPLNLNFNNWGWNFGLKATKTGIGMTGSGNGFSFGFSYSW